MAGLLLPAKREEPMDLTGGHWEIPRQKGRIIDGRKSQHLGNTQQGLRTGKGENESQMTHVIFCLGGGNPNCWRIENTQFYWRNKFHLWTDSTASQRNKNMIWTMNIRFQTCVQVATWAHTAAHSLFWHFHCTRSDCRISLEGWNFCVWNSAYSAPSFGCLFLNVSYCLRVIPG